MTLQGLRKLLSKMDKANENKQNLDKELSNIE